MKHCADVRGNKANSKHYKAEFSGAFMSTLILRLFSDHSALYIPSFNSPETRRWESGGNIKCIHLAFLSQSDHNKRLVPMPIDIHVRYLDNVDTYCLPRDCMCVSFCSILKIKNNNINIR